MAPTCAWPASTAQPLAVYVTSRRPGAADGPYPLIVQSHGWGVPACGPGDTQYYGPTADAWAQQGYAVLQIVARGFRRFVRHSPVARADPVGCQNGYIRLDDERYEAHDAQYAAGLLVDEAIADPSADRRLPASRTAAASRSSSPR